MPHINIDQEIYDYLCSQTRVIGEDASSILRRLLKFEDGQVNPSDRRPTRSEGSSQLDARDLPADEVEADSEDERVREFIQSAGWKMCESAVDKFLWILSWLHSHHRVDFERVCQVKGRERLYFARSQELLELHGNSVKPQKIMGSEYWVITNNDTGKKVQIIRQVMEVLGYRRENRDRIAEELAHEAPYRIDARI